MEAHNFLGKPGLLRTQVKQAVIVHTFIPGTQKTEADR